MSETSSISLPEAASAMIDAAQFFHQRGWLMGTCGNLSVQVSREPYQVLVTPSGKDKSRLKKEDFLLVDQHSRSLNGGGKASEELSVHQEIYRLTSARAVYHVHSIPNNLASHLWLEEGSVGLEGIEMIKGIAGKTLHDRVQVPIVSNSHDMPQLAASVAAGVRADVPAVLVYQHGIYVWGSDPHAARRHVEVFEFLFDYVTRLAAFQRQNRELPAQRGTTLPLRSSRENRRPHVASRDAASG